MSVESVDGPVSSQVEYQRAYYDQHFPKRVGAVEEQLAHPLFRSFYDRLAERVFDGAPAVDDRPLRVLDTGCGEGLLGSALHRVAERRGVKLAYTGTDLSAAALDLAQGHVEGNLIPGDAIEVLAGLPSSSQDVVVVKNLLHHLDAPEALLVEANRLVRPDGRVIVVEACLGCPQFWVFSLLAPKRERYFFRGRRRNLAAIQAGGLRVIATDKFSWLPYELAFAIRFNWFRRLFSTSDSRRIERVSKADDRLTRALSPMACYIVWVTAPVASGTAEGSTNST